MPRVATRRRASPTGDATKQRLVEAAAKVLAGRGFAAATARAIGEEAGCNQALVFYHFGSLNGLLLAALDSSSEQRLGRYREALGQARTVRDLRRIALRLYREDRRTGHVTILAELVAGGLADRELGAAVTERVEPWVELAAEAIRKVLPAAVGRRMPVERLAYALVALFLGLEILGQLAGDHTRGERVIDRLMRGGKPWPTGAEVEAS